MENENTGNMNTGNRNTGDCNTGRWNTGDCNTGDCNTGRWNTGDCNTGNMNTGNRNTGSLNTGDCNTGRWNTGRWNTGDCNTGDCNTNTPTVRLFNNDSGWDFLGEKHSEFRNKIYSLSIPLCEWVSEINMTDEDKEKYLTYKTTGGYLKVNDLKQSKAVLEEDVEYFKSLPNFDADILLKCTGIDITNKKVKIVFDGKEILISRESFEEIKKQFSSDS